MANVTFKRNTREIINATPIVDGQILFETDTKNIYMDEGSNRIEYRATTIDIDNELSTTSENPVQNKVITTNMNDLEDRVEAGFNELNSNLTVTKCKKIVTTLKPPANLFVSEDITFDLPEGAVFSGIAYYITEKDSWREQATVYYQSLNTRGARLIVACTANINITVVTEVFYEVKA